jgi:hypothetical protein
MQSCYQCGAAIRLEWRVLPAEDACLGAKEPGARDRRPIMKPMSIPHEAARAAGWPLATGAVASLAADAAPRLLLVLCGQVWITERVEGGAGRVVDDHWLGAGQTLALPAGSRWIVEAHRGARLVLLQAPPGMARRPSIAATAWRALRQARHALTGRPAAPGVA